MDDALAQRLASTEDANAGIVGGDAGLDGVVLHRDTFHIDAAERQGVLGLQGF